MLSTSKIFSSTKGKGILSFKMLGCFFTFSPMMIPTKYHNKKKEKEKCPPVLYIG
jgi:hypothetical protein